MLLKKSMIFLLSFVGVLYSAQSEISHVKEPYMWRQRFDKRDLAVERVFIVLEWPDHILDDHVQLLGEQNIFSLIKTKSRNEQLLVVSFWEQPPTKCAHNGEYKLFKAAGLRAYYCPQKSRLIIFSSQSGYGVCEEGIPAVKGDYKDYEGFPALIEQVMRYRSSEQDNFREVFCVGTVPLLECVRKHFTHRSIAYFCLEPLEEGKPSPVREFTQSSLDVLHRFPERPIAIKKLSPMESEMGRKLLFELEKPTLLCSLRHRIEKLRTLE